MMLIHHARFHGRSRRAFTLAEMMIGIGISSLVMATIALLMYMAARQTKDLVGQTRMRSARQQAIDQIRYRLSNGRFGSISISDDMHDITFLDPNVSPTINSRFSFNPADKTLYYDDLDGEGAGPVSVAKGPIEISFKQPDDIDTPEIDHDPAIVIATVKSEASMAYRQLDEQEGEVVIYLRNP